MRKPALCHMRTTKTQISLRTTKALIRLPECAGWSVCLFVLGFTAQSTVRSCRAGQLIVVPLLFAYGINRFYHDVAQIFSIHITYQLDMKMFDAESFFVCVQNNTILNLATQWILCVISLEKFACKQIVTTVNPFEPSHEKTCLCHMRTTKTQISLRIRAISVYYLLPR